MVLGHSDQEMVQLKNVTAMRKKELQDCFSVLREQTLHHPGVPWESALEVSGAACSMGSAANTGKEQPIRKHSQYFKDIYSMGNFIWLFFITLITRKLSLKCERCLGQ